MIRPLLICSILVVAAGVAVYLRVEERQARSAAAELAEGVREVPAEAVARAVSAMKLVTVEIDTHVDVRRGDDNWRGVVTAEVSVPVRLFYGTNLEGLVSRVVVGPLGPSAGMVVTVPRPERIATELFSDRETRAIEAGGLRLRSRAGEYYLGLARRDAAAAAREMRLSAEHARQVERRTAEQVEAVVKKIVGVTTPVRVRFEGDRW